MEGLYAQYDLCAASPAYIHLPEDAAAFGRLRALPRIVEDYGPGQCCGTCRHFIQHYRYTGSPPWYTPVGCGHCVCREVQRGRSRRDPLGSGCRHWEG